MRIENLGIHGHMMKTKRQMIEDLKLIDVVVEVTDARIPNSSRNPDIEMLSKDKKKIIILNKQDLADDNITKEWIAHYKNKGIVAIAIDSSKKIGMKYVLQAIEVVGKDATEKYTQKGRTGRRIKVMIFGIPNVGKSTLINALANRNVAKAENRPGVTKQKQWIKLNDNIELMDTPGMLWPKLQNNTVSMHLAYTNSIGQNAMDNEETAFELLKYLCENYANKIEERYGIEVDEQILSTDDLYEKNEYVLKIRDTIAKKKGCILQGTKVDETKVSNMVLNDFQSGKIGKISLERPEN